MTKKLYAKQIIQHQKLLDIVRSRKKATCHQKNKSASSTRSQSKSKGLANFTLRFKRKNKHQERNEKHSKMKE